METRVLKMGAAILATIAWAAVFAGCSKLKAGDTFTATTEGVEYQYEIIVSKMRYVRVVPVSDRLSGDITIPATVSYDGDSFVVTQIGENAFRGCSSITSVTLPKTLSIIEPSAFAGCTSLQRINTPQPLSEMGDYAFDGCVSLKEFSLDASISSLGKGCFRGCSALKTIQFPSSFTEIPEEAFFGCAGLEEIHCPATVMQIGDDAFGECANVHEIYLDRSVQRIGKRAFAGCGNVASMTCLTATPPVCSADTFEGIHPDTPVTVMKSSMDHYKTATGWNHFTNYKGIY